MRDGVELHTLARNSHNVESAAPQDEKFTFTITIPDDCRTSLIEDPHGTIAKIDLWMVEIGVNGCDGNKASAQV